MHSVKRSHDHAKFQQPLGETAVLPFRPHLCGYGCEKTRTQVAHQNRINGHSRNVICLILLSDVPKAFLYLFPLPGLCYRPAWASACVFPCVNAYGCLLACIAVKVNSVHRGRFRNISTWCFLFFSGNIILKLFSHKLLKFASAGGAESEAP